MTIDTLPARLQFEASPHNLRSPFTPIGYTPGGTAIYPAQGGRGGGGISFAVGDDEGDDPEFDDEQDNEQDEDDDEQDDEPAARKRTARRNQRADESGENDEGDDDWQPPTREAWERVTGSLKRANSEAGKRRRVGKMMDKLGIDDLSTWLTARGIDPETGAPFGNDVVDPADDGDGTDPADEYGYEREDTPPRRRADDDRDARTRDRQIARQLLTAEQRGRAAARDEMMPILAEYAARTALRDAGFIGTPRQLERALRSIDPGSLDLSLTDDGFELVGIEDEIAALQDDFPDYFKDATSAGSTRRSATSRTADRRATSRTRGGAREVDGGERGRQPAKPRGWKEQIAEQMARSRR